MNEMMDEFERITDDLLAIDISTDIDDAINKVEELLNRRANIINEINSIGKKVEITSILLQKNNHLQEKLSEISVNISEAIIVTKNEKALSSKKKKAHRGYLNPGHQNDGYFIDKKK